MAWVGNYILGAVLSVKITLAGAVTALSVVKRYGFFFVSSLGGSVGYMFDWWSGGCGFDSCLVGQQSNFEIDILCCWFKKGICQFLEKECAQVHNVLVNRLED